MKYSIIIPVYNVEQYLNQCVESVLSQNYSDFEILLINDGSTDSSGSICNQWGTKDKRIKVIHKENGGLSSARNTGMKNACGDYILFLDSDDFWDDKNSLMKIYNCINDHSYDVINYFYKYYFEDDQTYRSVMPKIDVSSFKDYENEERKKQLVNNQLFVTSACNKVISKQMIIDNDLYFTEGITSEDIDWCARLLLVCNNMGIIENDFYVYRQRSNSISRSMKLKNLIDLSNNVERCIDYVSSKNIEESFKTTYLDYVAYQYGTFFVGYHLVNDSKKKVVLEKMKEYKWLLKYNSLTKVKLLYLLNKFLSFNGMVFVMGIYARLKK